MSAETGACEILPRETTNYKAFLERQLIAADNRRKARETTPCTR
jgi:hypothetical protein